MKPYTTLELAHAINGVQNNEELHVIVEYLKEYHGRYSFADNVMFIILIKAFIALFENHE